MPDYNVRFTPEIMRSIAGASLTNMYQDIGTPISNPSRLIIFVNGSGVIVYISWDGINDHIVLLPGAAIILDETSNAVSNAVLATAAKTQFQARAPANVAGTDNVYLSTFYAS